MHNKDDFDDDVHPFEKELREYLYEYASYLNESEKLKPATVRKHENLLGAMISYVFDYHQVNGFEDLSLSIIGSKMLRSYNHHSSEAVQLSTHYNTMRKFFRFVYKKHGIANHDLLRKLSK